MNKPDIYLSVILPAYNEAGRLPRTLTRLHQYLCSQTYTYEILVVLDGPTDGTRDAVQSLMPEISHLKLVDRSVNRGKGYTVKEGMLKASGQIRLFSDADNSTDIVHFEQMKPLFDRGCDLVIASRHPKDIAGARQAVPQSKAKRMAGHLGNVLVQLLAVPGVWDTQCGFKAFRAGVAERIFSRTRIEGWGFDIEVLALARALDYRLGMIAAHWINDDSSHFRALDYLRVFGETLKVRGNFLARKYSL